MDAPSSPISLTIPARFNGFPDIAQGGYVAGTLAAYVPAPVVQVTLRRPPPLERALTIHPLEDRAELTDGEHTIAEAAPGVLEEAPADAVSFEEALEATKRYEGHREHPWPSCFCCGTGRAPGDGLRIHAGPVGDGQRLASPWVPYEGLAAAGEVRPEYVWAVLDCPTLWALRSRYRDLTYAVTGRMTVTTIRPVRAGEPHAVVAWPISRRGRRSLAGAAVYTASAELAAWGLLTWFELREPAEQPGGARQ